jgi:hypothetical protein
VTERHRYVSEPPKLQTVDPRDICLSVPCKTGLLDVLCVAGLCNVIGTGRLANQPLIQFGGSNVQTVRTMIVHEFMERTKAEWLVCVDDDIGFRTTDWDLLWEDQAGELAVCAEYLQKIDGQQVPAVWGLGFARIHRRVFELIQDLTTHDGQPWVRQGIFAGRLMWDYFPQGVTPAGELRQEDHAFWQLVRMTGVPVRLETRTRLAHSGRSTWHYDAEALARADEEQGAAQ